MRRTRMRSVSEKQARWTGFLTQPSSARTCWSASASSRRFLLGLANLLLQNNGQVLCQAASSRHRDRGVRRVASLGRTLQALGHHRVRLISAQYVKPFVKRGKNDSNDAKAISEAAARPGMRSVPIKSAERQADAMLLSVRELLMGQRTQLVNALRGHAAEFGLVTRTGVKGVTQLLPDAASDPSLPGPAADALALLGQEIDRLEACLVEIDTPPCPA